MRIFAVFGDPIEHSISPRLHNQVINDFNLKAVYTRILLKDGTKLIDKFNELGLSGANVTLPHKHEALKLSDYSDEFSKKIGSANTLVKKDDKICAYNTDAFGFLKSISSFDDVKTALILGAGGTAKAMAYALNSVNIKADILNKSRSRFADFPDFNTYCYDDFSPKKYDLIINSTPAGLKEYVLPAPKELLAPCFLKARFAFDAIYGVNTPFLDMAQAYDLARKDGREMLLFQAVLAFNLFYNNTFDEFLIEKSMRKALSLS